MVERRGFGVLGRAGLGLAVALLVWVGFAVGAVAAHGERFVHEIVAGGSGTGEGQFGTGAQDVAVNRSSVADGSTDPLGVSTDGFVYVADSANNRIQVFDSDGEFRFLFGRGVLDGAVAAQVCTVDDGPCLAGVSGVEGGMFNRPQGVVIDHGSGHVFVRDRGNRRVQEFEADGSFVRAWGWDVVASGPGDDVTAAVNEFETCVAANGDVCKTGVDGTGAGQFASSSLSGGGIDLHGPSGDLLVADPGTGQAPSLRRVQRFDVPANATDPVSVVSEFGPFTGFAAGGLGNVHVAVDDSGIVYAPNSASVLARYDLNTSSFITPLDVAAVSGTDPAASLVGLEVDPTTDDLFVARDRSLAGTQRVSPVVELSDPGAADPAGVDLVDVHVDGTDYAWAGIGLDPDDPAGCMYLTGLSADFERSLVRACEGPLAPPVVVFGSYSGVGARSATVNFSVDTTGELAVGYQVQLSNPESLGSFVTVASGQVAGSPTPVDVSETLTGLRPGTAYQVRVVATKPYNNPAANTINPTPLVTQGEAPSVIDVGADSVTDTSARLTGRIDPNGENTSYRFEWGTDSFENSIPVPDGALGDGYGFEQVTAQLDGLDPATTYQFRLVATSSQGTTTRPAGGQTFTTLAAPSQTARAFELVTPSDKYGGQGVGFWPAGLGHLGSSGVAAHVGDRFAAEAQFGSTLDGDGAFSHSNDFVLAERGNDTIGWQSRSPLTHPNYAPRTGQPVELRAAAPDLSAMYWAAPSSLAFFPEMSDGGPVGTRPGWSNFAVGVMSDWGGPFGPPTRWELFGPRSKDQVVDQALLAGGELSQLAFSRDGSTALAQTQRRAGSSGLSEVFGLAGMNDPTWPSPANPSTPGVPAYGDLVSGRSVYLGDLSDGMADSFAGTPDRELVNVCSGTGVDRTHVPSSDGASFAQAECPAGIDGRDALISPRGAALTPTTYIRKGMVSRGGSRVFFLSPDPLAAGVRNGSTTFCTGTGAATSCPPQLFVRQRNDDGSVVTRWVSKPEPALFGQQAATLLGTARFEGASADGSRVYFRSNTPLTVDDPNGLGAPTPDGVKTGQPAASSWDLYMVELADGPDPMGAGATVTRVSAGPGGAGDCNSPLPTLSVTGEGDDDTVGALRFLSDDGSRAYFTCQAPLPGVGPSADEQRITAPGGTQTTSDQANLYLYDHDQPQTDRWRFIARLPRATDSSLATCASTGIERRSPFAANNALQPAIESKASGSNCFNGTADGRFVTLFTPGRLTVDDPGGTPADDPPGNPVADIYGYDAEGDRLTRITAPQGGDGAGYPCIGDVVGNSVDESLLHTCRGDGGMDFQVGVSHRSEGIANLGVALTATGERVAFFHSASRLTGDDLDSGYDVYEWRDGKLSLVTSGAVGSQDALYKGNDVTGTNVYFVTRESLTWQDADVVADIYTARTGGGIAQPPPPPTCDILPGQCQGGGATPLPVPSSRTKLPGSGNVSPGGVRPGLLLVRPSAKGLKAVVGSGVLRLGVRVGGPGVVRGVVRARFVRGEKLRRVGSGRVRVRRAGRVVLRLRLSRPAMRRLRSGRPLVVSVRVSGLGAVPKGLRLSVPGRAGK